MASPILLKAQIELLQDARCNCFGVYNSLDKVDQKTQDQLQHACEFLTAAQFKLQTQLEELEITTASH